MITPKHVNGIDIRGFPSYLQDLENTRSSLILEGRLLLAQQAYSTAADKFAQAAEMSEPFIAWAQANDKHGYEFVQRLQEISLWTKAGSPRRALQLAKALQTASFLNATQKQHVATYTAELETQLTKWLVTLSPVQGAMPVPA